jgi:hypothetical protein
MLGIKVPVGVRLVVIVGVYVGGIVFVGVRLGVCVSGSVKVGVNSVVGASVGCRKAAPPHAELTNVNVRMTRGRTTFFADILPLYPAGGFP